MERDDWTRQQDRDRQAEWRRRQDDKGMVQVRVWVPQGRAAEVVVFADHLRRGDGIMEPSTPKQRYEARRAAKRLGIPEPPPEVMGDRYRLEVWLLSLNRRE